MSNNLGNLKQNADGVTVGRITTLAFSAVIALREVNSSNERAPAFDVMALSADRTNWVKIGAVWEFSSKESGESFLSGRIDDPSLAKPIDVAMFRQEDGSYNVSWRRNTRKQAPAPAMTSDDSLPPLDGSADDSPAQTDQAGDGLGESTAGTTKSKSRKSKEKADA